MCDIHLNEATQIQEAIQTMINKDVVNRNDIEGSLFDMVTQNNPFSDRIKNDSQLAVKDYLIISKDFNFKTQLMRSLEINAENSYKLILDTIMRINHQKYNDLLEHDMYRIMEKNDIKGIFGFFEVSSTE